MNKSSSGTNGTTPNQGNLPIGFALPNLNMESDNLVTPDKEPEQQQEVLANDASKIANIDKIENYLNERFDFCYNEVTNRLEYRKKDIVEYVPMSDYMVNSTLRSLQKHGINTNITALRALLYSDFTAVYNPFEEYFNALPEWDGKTNYLKELAATVKTSNDELWEKCFKKWMVAVVAGVLEPEALNHTVIVLTGKQGIGKTSWILNLVPEELAAYKFSGTINPDNKDTLLQLSECMLINLDELENLNRTELGSLKELITKDSIRMRRAYGYHTENLIRRASFAGSVNNKEFLTDTTGARRFLPFEAIEIDYNHKVDLKMVYVQSLSLYESGFKYWFDTSEIDEINANNEQYRIMSPEEELLLTYYEPVDEKEAILFLTATAIGAELSAKAGRLPASDTSKIKLGKALHKHKFIRLKRKGIYVWALRERNHDTVEGQKKIGLLVDHRG